MSSPNPVLSDPRLARLFTHPAIWRGRSAARFGVVPTGFAALDASLPGNGWPQIGLVEILTPCLGVGELYLLLPALACLTRRPAARWCAWIAPPCEPFAPALAAHGVRLSRVLVVHADHAERAAPAGRADPPLWACEQALRSGACEAVLAWLEPGPPRALRRLQLAAERGRTLAFMFRTLSRLTAREPTYAILRIAVEPKATGARVRLLKSRGGSRETVDLEFGAAPEA
jgi:protein ImuA